MTTDELFGKHVTGRDRLDDYVAWAVHMMESGHDSMNLAILAGLDLEKPIYRPDVENYFGKALADLDILWPEPEDALRSYADVICRKILNDEIEPKAGVDTLSRLYAASHWTDVLLSIWEWVEEDLYFYRSEGRVIVSQAAATDNLEAYIKAEARLFLRLRQLDLPPLFSRSALCPSCNHLVEPETPSGYVSVCTSCGAGRLHHLKSYEGRSAYVEGEDGL